MNYPQFIDDETFSKLHSSKSEWEQVVALSENLKKLHILTTAQYDNFDQLILTYLQTGLEIFSMEIGIVSQIESDDYTICNALSPNEVLKKGDLFPLEGTYCREVFKTQKVLGFPHVGALEEMKDHPVYQNMKLESYLSAPIFVDKELFGTLNFTSTKIRPHGFSEHEKDLISLMANSIGNFLSLDRKEQALIQTNKQLKRLVGFVSHDLRIPLGNINSLAQMVISGTPEEQETYSKIIQTTSAETLEMVYTILDIAAMGSGKIEVNRENTDLATLIQKATDQLATLREERAINFEINIPDTLNGFVDKNRMVQVFTNLYSNVLRYTPKNGSASLQAKTTDDGRISFSIRNDIAKIQLLKSNKQDITQSTGFGLEIVREILALHDSELSTELIDKQFTASFSLSTD